MLCWKCGKKLEDPVGQIPFRATCDHCHAYLHVCKNCRYYQPGLPNDCKIPDTPRISDREASNFCDEFSLNKEGKREEYSSERAEKLFGEEKIEEKKPPKDRFDNLFK